MKKRLVLIVLIIATWMGYLAFQKRHIDAVFDDAAPAQRDS